MSGERAMVPPAEFRSYYGRPVLKAPVWKADIPAYFFLGGLAAGSSLLAAGGDLTGDTALRRSSRLAAAGAIGLGAAFLVKDLGRPARFLNMLRVARPTSPMSMGSWTIAAYGPLAGAAAASEVLGVLPRLGRLAGAAAACLAPAVASYTAVVLTDTSIPVWKESWEELPIVFTASATAAAGGLALVTTRSRPARRAAVAGAVSELLASRRMECRMGMVAEPLRAGRAGAFARAARFLTGAGALGALAGRRSRVASALSGAALLAGSACMRRAIVEAGTPSALDPAYTVVPQRRRLLDGAQVV